MDLSERIFRYCERGVDPSFWAEPVNAVSNVAFIVAGVLAGAELLRRRAGEPRAVEAGIVALMFAMGVGSFLFHTSATRWASFADSGPIGIFMLAYLAFALRRFLGLDWMWTAVGLAGFVAALKAAGEIECHVTLVSAGAAAPGPCLNGTAGYVPALVALSIIALALRIRGHAPWKHLALASVVFAVSMICRTIDWEVCELTRVGGHRLGTHYLWHLLNATTLYILADAAIRYGRRTRLRT